MLDRNPSRLVFAGAASPPILSAYLAFLLLSPKEAAYLGGRQWNGSRRKHR
jgi:hypothetical protein